MRKYSDPTFVFPPSQLEGTKVMQWARKIEKRTSLLIITFPFFAPQTGCKLVLTLHTARQCHTRLRQLGLDVAALQALVTRRRERPWNVFLPSCSVAVCQLHLSDDPLIKSRVVSRCNINDRRPSSRSLIQSQTWQAERNVFRRGTLLLLWSDTGWEGRNGKQTSPELCAATTRCARHIKGAVHHAANAFAQYSEQAGILISADREHQKGRERANKKKPSSPVLKLDLSLLSRLTDPSEHKEPSPFSKHPFKQWILWVEGERLEFPMFNGWHAAPKEHS